MLFGRKGDARTPRAGRRFGGWLQRAVLVLGVLAVAGEVLLRAFPELCPPQQQLKIAETTGFHEFVDDPYLGARLAPLVHDTIRTADYQYAVELDSLGFPNRLPWPKHTDIVVLGNSLVVGPGVGIDGQFTSLLARALDGRSVLNLGLPGGSPQQELRIYSRYARPLHPKVVVATLWVASDVDNTVQFEHWLAEGSPPDFTAYRQTYGTTHGELSSLKDVRDFLSRSYLLRAFFYEVKGVVRPDNLRERVTFPDGETLFLSVRAQRRLAQGAERPDFDLDSGFVAPLRQLRTAAESDGARFIVVLMPSKEETYGADSFPAVLNTVRDVRERLLAAGFPVLDLYDAFRATGKSRPLFWQRDIHFNAGGNALTAQAIARWIVDSGVVASRQAAPAAGGGAEQVAERVAR